LQAQVFRDEVHEVKAILDLLDGILFHLRHGGKLTALPVQCDAVRLLSRGDDWKTERLSRATHPNVVRHNGREIGAEAEGSGQVDGVKRPYRGRLDSGGSLEKIVVQANEVNRGQLPSRPLH
jgi:hypothetical protein